jgi:tetratricopeptide (TPR) repeat protein
MVVAAAGSGIAAQPCTAPPNLHEATQTQRTAASYAALADYFTERQNYPCAIEAFQSALSVGAGWETRYRLALAFAAAGDGASAAIALNEILKQNPGILPARNALGKLLKNRGEYTAAQTEFESALRIDPRSTYALYNLAQTLMALQRYPAAVPYLEQAVALEPQDLGFRMALAVADWNVGKDDAAIGILGPLIASYAGDSLFATQRGILKEWLANDDESGALQRMTEYTLRNPQDGHGYCLLGLALREFGKYENALRAFRRAVQLMPSDYTARYNLGFVLMRREQPAEARAELEIAARLDRDAAAVHFQLAAALRALNDFEGARREMREFARRKKGQDHAYAVLERSAKADELLHSGDPRAAAAMRREVAELDPGNSRAWYNLAIALDRIGDVSAEESALHKAIGLDSNFALAHNQLGLVYIQQSRNSEAETELRHAVALNPNLAEAHNNLGVLYGKTGRIRPAMDMFRQAISNNSEYGQAHLNLALILAAQGRRAEASAEAKTALRIDVGDQRAAELLNLLRHAKAPGIP